MWVAYKGYYLCDSMKLYILSFQIPSMKEKFTISIEKDIFEAVEETVKTKEIGANRSQVIEYCVKQTLELRKCDAHYMEFLIKFFKLVELHPEAGEKLQELLKTEVVGH